MKSISNNGDAPLTAPKPRFSLKRFGYSWRAVGMAISMIPVFIVIHLLAYWLRFESLGPNEWRWFWSLVGGVVAAKTVVFFFMRVFQGWSRYVTFHDLMAIVKAETISLALFVAAGHFFVLQSAGPRSILLLDWGLTIMVLGGLRSSTRAFREGVLSLLASKHGKPVFIVGADDCGEGLLRVIRSHRKLHYDVMGFIDDVRRHSHYRIGGVPVLGGLADAARLAEQYGVKEILITAGNLNGKEVRSLVRQGSEHGFEVNVLPSFHQLLGQQVSMQPRPVSISDLLRREPIHLDQEAISDWLCGRTVMVTGSAGSIGSEICRQLMALSGAARLVLVDRWENGQFFLDMELRGSLSNVEYDTVIADLTDPQRMRQVMGQYRPDVIFHAAAYKHVPLMEQYPAECVKNVILATKRLADLADEFDVESFVMVSTDKAVNPANVMGACKRAAEMYVQRLNATSTTRFVSVRFGNVLDSAGSVVPIFREQIARGGPITVTDARMERFFMTIPEASQLVIQAGAIGAGGEIYLLDMGEPVRIVDLARDMIQLSGLREGIDIEIVFTGLRPGEKLAEILHGEAERRRPTQHPKVLLVESDPPRETYLGDRLEALRAHLTKPSELVVEAIQDIVTEFQPAEDLRRPAAEPAAAAALTAAPALDGDPAQNGKQTGSRPFGESRPASAKSGEMVPS